MGLLWTLIWWMSAFSVTSLAVFLTIGDRLVTLLAQRFGSEYLGEKFAIRWSLSAGLFELSGVSLGRAVLAIVEPMLGMPMDLEFVRIELFRFEFPWTLLLSKSNNDKPLQTTTEVAGLQLGLSVNEPEKWLAVREENHERFQQTVKQAAQTRLGRADAWTAAVVQKLKDLAVAQATVAGKAKQKPTPSGDATKPATTTAPPARWQQKVDALVDSFVFVLSRMAVTIRDDYSASGIGITLERFEIGRARSLAAEKETKRTRTISVDSFALFVNPVAHSDKPFYMVEPMTMAIQLTTPYIMQSLLMAQIQEKRELQVVISFSSDVVLQVRPAQLAKLMKLLRPLSFHGDWYQRATALDESSCVELVGAEKEEYMALYHEEYKLDHETGFVGRIYAKFQQKAQIQERKERLKALEQNVLASRLLYMRSVALDWPVPSGGAALPHLSGALKRRKDLRMFLANPMTVYVPELEAPPMFDSLSLSLSLQGVEVQLLDDMEQRMLTIFARDMCMGLEFAMTKVALHEIALDVDFKIQRFGIADERNVPTNVFRRLLDQNPGATHLLALRMTQTGAGQYDLDFSLADFTLLVIFDPLLHTTKVFLPALTEDEETELKYLAYSGLQTPLSPERREEMTPVYKSDVPQEYSPLFLGGMPLRGQVAMHGCEICLLGDSSSIKSHVLAFTSDASIKIVSSARHEAVELELVDVALQPCAIVVLENAIGLEIAGLQTILELEGEGVDLLLGYRLNVGDAKPPVASARSTEGASEPGRGQSGANLWGVARSAMVKNQIVAVDHTALRKAEEDALLHSASGRMKAGARRKLVMRMSDFALNMSPNDLGVLLSIVAALNEAMKEDVEVVQEHQERERRLVQAKKQLAEQRQLERLKTEFQLRDVDGGGTLDTQEVAGLIASVVNCQRLTKDEFDATVRDFLSIVDRDGSGDVSLEEFESVLSHQKLVYHHLHQGVVSLTGYEYVDGSRPRSSVPTHKDEHGRLANTAALAQFWERYEQQVGATPTTLNEIPANIVQKKMVRAFKNYEYAQEAWNRLVNPSLTKPAEKSAWLLTKEMDMGSRGNVLDELLSSLDSGDQASQPLPATSYHEDLRLFIHTIVSTSFGGFYIRLIDENTATRMPSIEFSLEELAVYANVAVWEGELPHSEADLQVRKRARRNDYGVAKVSFAVYGKYYNPSARQVEPFLEYFPGTLDVRKDSDAPLQVLFTSDRYFQLNVTFAFMEVVKTNLSTFSKVEALSARERPHIKEEGGLFWMHNETGVNLKYYVVAKKQTKERVRVETVSAVSSVPPNEAHPCVLLTLDEEMKDYEQQHMKEKQLRQAFRNADSDNSGELDTHEVRAVLVEVYEEEYRNSRKRSNTRENTRESGGRASSLYTRESVFSSDGELDKIVDDFIALADTDGSGQVSWEEFKVAISKSRETVDRFISLEVEGYEPLHNIPIASIGHTQVHELTPYFEDVECEKSVAFLYQQGVMLLNGTDTPSRGDLEKAFACFRRVRELDPHYEWIDSYYSECVRKYLPVLIAVEVFVDGALGLQVKVTGATYIRNDTDKPTECLLVDEKGEDSIHNPVQRPVGESGVASKERFFVVPPSSAISIPLDLVDVGSFAIRQTGETEWSNYLPLSVHEQRMYKNLTRFEQHEAQRALRNDLSGSTSSLSTTRMVSEKMGKDVALPNLNEYVPPGKELVYPSTSVIDNQPTLVVEKISINDHQLGTWSIVIQPQLLLHNVLPCGIEYAIVQTRDCPADMLDSNGRFRAENSSNRTSSARSVKMLGKIDYFQYVTEVNCRRMYVESGKNLQVFGLDLDAPALMKVRLCANESNRGGTWSPSFMVNLNTSRDVFDAGIFELRFGDQVNDGPAIVIQQQWQPNSARSLSFFAPYWIQNRSGLDFRFRMAKGGTTCSIEAHRTFFNGAKEIPLLVNAPATKAMLSVRPFQETARAYEGEFLVSQQTKKYLPNFDRVDWSEQQDMASVGTKGELGAHDHSFVVAFEILAAPGQFFRSKIFRVSPRVIIVNRVPRPLSVTPLMMDKKLRIGNVARGRDVQNASLRESESVIVYHFAGSEKHHAGLRLRDTFRDEALKDLGEWTPCLPLKPGDDYNVWTRGSLGDGPAVNVAFQNVEETIIATIEDVTKTPRYRIENRSTRFAFRYVQNGVRNAEEIVIKPLESHSFVWDDPLEKDRKLKVTPLNWKIPTLIDLRHIGPRTMLTSNGMYSEVYIDGATRVFAVGDTPTYAADRERAALNDWLSNTLIDVALHGFGLTIVDALPQEIMNLTMEKMRIESAINSRRVVLSLHHMQIDDMTAHSLYPVVFAPIDSGFNSDKREGWLPQDGDRPFFSLAIDTMPQQSSITIVNEFEMDIQSMAVKLNLEYVLGLVNLLLEFIPTSEAAAVIQQGVDYKEVLLTLELNVPEHAGHGGMLLYFKKWRMSPFDFELVFDSAAEDKGEGISSLLGSTVGSIVGGIAHVTPEFSFREILYENRFFYEYDLVYSVIVEIVYSVLGQWYKIVGSVEMLGDPVGLATDIVDGFALAVRQLKRDVKGKSVKKGQSAMTIVQTVIGAPMKSLGKVSNGLGDVVKKATDFQSQEGDAQPRHVPEGLLQSGVVFTKSIAYGFKGFVKEPVQGAKRDGVKGFAKGLGRGTLQLMASPVVGTLGVVEKLSTSMNNTTHLMDEKQFEGTRRPARDLGDSALKSLSDSNVITEVELHVLSVEGLPEKSNPQIVVRVYQQEKGGPARDVAKYKSSTMHHTGKPSFDQSWLIPVTSQDTFMEVMVFHKRKPMPKKQLGHVRFSMEQIYREFEGVPANILWDMKAKMRLRRRKRVRGSILNELAMESSQSLEVRDESWRQKISRPSMATFLDEYDDAQEDDDDDYDQDVELLSSRSIVIDQPYEIKPVAFPLEGTSSDAKDAKIFLNIRYVNDMRR